MIQLESIRLGQMDIGKSHTRIRTKPLDVDLAITSHQSCGMDIHALVAYPNGDFHPALAANRCSRMAMSNYTHTTNYGTSAYILAMK